MDCVRIGQCWFIMSNQPLKKQSSCPYNLKRVEFAQYSIENQRDSENRSPKRHIVVGGGSNGQSTFHELKLANSSRKSNKIIYNSLKTIIKN